MEAVTISCFLLICATLSARCEDFNLLILHNNDMHGRFEETEPNSGTCKPKNLNRTCVGGFARTAYEIRKHRQLAKDGKGPPVLYLNAGDTFTGTAWFSTFTYNISAEMVNMLEPDAVCLGNHEFDQGVEGLVPFVNGLGCPVLAANLDFSLEPTLNKVKPSTILEVSGRKIGIIGYLTTETRHISTPGKTIFLSEVESVRKEAAKLHNEGINIIIALGHAGYLMDQEIAKRVPHVDVVVGGHTNTFLWNGPQPDLEQVEGPYPTVVTQSSGKKVPVVQAFAYTKYLGRLNLTFNDAGDLTNFYGQPELLVGAIPQDDDVLQALEEYRPKVLEINKEIVGTSKVILDGSAGRCRTQECVFGNLIADALVQYVASGSVEKWTNTPIALVNGGGIRNTIDPSHTQGKVSRGELLGALPFGNQVMTLTLKGSDLVEALEQGVRSNGETSRGEFLQVSGLKVVINWKRPVGKRIVSVEAICGPCKTPEYSKLMPDEYYRLATFSFLTNGGDGHTVLQTKGLKYKTEDLIDIDVVAWYFKRFSPVSPKKEGRIIIISAAMPALGNHEFDNGVEDLGLFLYKLKSPVVATNLDFRNVPSLQNRTTKSVIIDVLGRKIGIVGYLTPETPDKSHPGKTVFYNEIEALNQETKRLREQNITIIIALGHSGHISDQQIAKEVELVDIVVGGHSHSFLWNGDPPSTEIVVAPYPTVVTQASGKQVPVVQAYAFTKYLGKLQVTFDDSGNLTSFNGLPIFLNVSIPQEKDFLDVLDKYRPKVDQLYNNVIGSTLVILEGDAKVCRYEECNFGNLLADALVTYIAATASQVWTSTPIGLFHAGSIQGSIDPFENGNAVSTGQLVTCLPFGNDVISLSLRGLDLIEVLEHAMSKGGGVEFLQVSGLRVIYDKSRPSGSRVVSVRARCGNCSIPTYQPVDLKRNYRVVTTSFIADGGDGHRVLREAGFNRTMEDLNDSETLSWYFEKYSPVYPSVEGRIKFVKKNIGGSSGTLGLCISLGLIYFSVAVLFV